MTKNNSIDNGRNTDKLKKILNRDNDLTKGVSPQGFSNKDNEKIEKENHELSEEVKKFKNALLVALADKENIKKTMEKDIDNARQYGIVKFAEQIVGSLDSLEKIMNSLSNNNDTLLGDIKNGIEMTVRQIEGVLRSNGIKKIMPLGGEFDHNYHQAVKTIPGKPSEKKMVKEVLQCGYVIKDRVLRAAMVVVFE